MPFVVIAKRFDREGEGDNESEVIQFKTYERARAFIDRIAEVTEAVSEHDQRGPVFRIVGKERRRAAWKADRMTLFDRRGRRLAEYRIKEVYHDVD